jgi:hypothetical protein
MVQSTDQITRANINTKARRSPLVRESVMIPRGISYPDIDNGVLHHHPKVDKEVYLVGTIYERSIQSPLDQAF